jgi:hypothetical protein
MVGNTLKIVAFLERLDLPGGREQQKEKPLFCLPRAAARKVHGLAQNARSRKNRSHSLSC